MTDLNSELQHARLLNWTKVILRIEMTLLNIQI